MVGEERKGSTYSKSDIKGTVHPELKNIQYFSSYL